MKIVVPVDNDKNTIFKKTGQAPFFAIYEDENILEYVENTHGHLHHNEHQHDHNNDHKHHEHTNAHKKDTSGLAGCDVILVRMVGENMREALESHGLKIKKVRQKDGEDATEIVKSFLTTEANL